MKKGLVTSSIFAGICIGVAGFGFLAEKSVGMFLFIFGLAAVVSYKLKLYTGTAGFISGVKELGNLGIILVGNLIGCLCVSLLSRCSAMNLQQTAQSLLESRLSLGWWKCGFLSIGCGMLMSAAVTFARRGKEFGNWIPLIFAVPLFIHCGFPHCVADAFYYMTCPLSFLGANCIPVFILYVSIVVGNFLGCNIWRVLVDKESF